ncbi:DUF1905 domain-containing protein [Candidatus Kaiserbacteria bacterium]|nr:DUF1905 domain-containing protein [Candidatus Kaiserbacteria bacterium]
MKRFVVKAKVWKWEGPAAWFFAYIPDKESKALRALPRPKQRGFGSIKVRIKVGKTSWDTSLFPTKEGPYVLPIKSSVRRKEGIDDGDVVKLECTIL